MTVSVPLYIKPSIIIHARTPSKPTYCSCLSLAALAPATTTKAMLGHKKWTWKNHGCNFRLLCTLYAGTSSMPNLLYREQTSANSHWHEMEFLSHHWLRKTTKKFDMRQHDACRVCRGSFVDFEPTHQRFCRVRLRPKEGRGPDGKVKCCHCRSHNQSSVRSENRGFSCSLATNAESPFKTSISGVRSKELLNCQYLFVSFSCLCPQVVINLVKLGFNIDQLWICWSGW